MSRTERLLAAAEAFHAASLTAAGWDSALAGLVDAFGGDKGMLMAHDADRVRLPATFAFEADELAGFGAVIRADCPVSRKTLALPQGSVLPNSAIADEDDFRRSLLYNEAVRRTGGFHALVAAPVRSPTGSFLLIIGRKEGRSDFEAAQVAQMRFLLPHVASSLRVSERLAGLGLVEAALSQATGRARAGVILLDRSGRVVVASAAAEALFEAGGGLWQDDGGICAATPAASRDLRRLIAGCTRPEPAHGGVVAIPRGPGRLPLQLTISPFVPGAAIPGDTFGRPPAAVIIADAPELDREHRRRALRAAYGLTAAEADVALEICLGDGRNAVAARLGIRLATVRSHLGRVFDKVGVRRQAELVRRLAAF